MSVSKHDDVVNTFPSDRANQSPLVNSIRPSSFRCSTTNWCRSAAFSASSRNAGLRGEISRLKNRNNSATIAPNGFVIPLQDHYGRRFRYTQG